MPPVNKSRVTTAPSAAKDRPVLYPEVQVNGVTIPVEKSKWTYDKLVALIGWEDEPAYKARKAGPDGDPESVTGFGENWTLKDEYGNPVRLHNNDLNRPYDESTSLKYTQDILDDNWPVNGETIIISQTGQVLSGQHRITGAIRAIQRWRMSREKYPKWTEEPYLKSLVVTGVSDDPAVVATLDNVRPRTLADTIYTSPVFKKYKSSVHKQQLSAMLDKAIDTLWKRTAAKEYAFHELQTHAASFDFLARHPKLKDAVIKVWEEDTGKAAAGPKGKGDISEREEQRNLVGYKVGLGNFAAALYLMGSAASDEIEYVKKGRKEKTLDWSLWDKAVEFVAGLAAEGDSDGPGAPLKHLRKAMADLIDADPDETMGGRVVEKLAVMAAAWMKFGEGERPLPSDLKLEYLRSDHTNQITKLSDPATFGGIDFGPYPTPGGGREEDGDQQSIEDARAEKEAETVAALKEKAAVATANADSTGSADPVEAQVEGIRQQNKGRTLLFKMDGSLKAFGVDAKPVADALDLKPIKRPNGGYPQVTVTGYGDDDAAAALRIKGLKLALVTFDERGGAKVTDWKAPFEGAQPAEKPAKAGKAKAAPGTALGANGSAAPAKKPAAPKAKAGLRGGVGG